MEEEKNPARGPWKGNFGPLVTMCCPGLSGAFDNKEMVSTKEAPIPSTLVFMFGLEVSQQGGANEMRS